MGKSTMVELVEELSLLPASDGVDFMIKEALGGEYHCFKNTKYDAPKTACCGKLLELGHTELALRVSEGEFDE